MCCEASILCYMAMLREHALCTITGALNRSEVGRMAMSKCGTMIVPSGLVGEETKVPCKNKVCFFLSRKQSLLRWVGVGLGAGLAPRFGRSLRAHAARCFFTHRSRHPCRGGRQDLTVRMISRRPATQKLNPTNSTGGIYLVFIYARLALPSMHVD